MARVLLLSLTLAVSVMAPAARGADSALTLSGFVTYRVAMETSLRVPSDRDVSTVRVWHATPTVRPWSMAPDPLGCLRLAPLPASAELLHREDKNSRHLRWEFAAPFADGGEIVCTSSFLVNSCVRRFYAKRSTTDWEDYKAKPKPTPDNTAAKVAQRLRERHPPAETVRRCCGWITDNLTYDASVPHASTDLEATLRARRGHCGHYYTVLRSMCQAVGVPIRRVFGLNLKRENALSHRLHRVRADYPNIHTWAEVHFPVEGWIEVEPSLKKTPFRVPANFIQNDPWFQNYSVWLRESGEWKQPRWIARAGGWDSDVSLQNRIDFSEVAAGSEPDLPRKWESAGGGFTVVASLLSVADGEANLATSDGRRLAVGLDKLRPADADFARLAPAR